MSYATGESAVNDFDDLIAARQAELRRHDDEKRAQAERAGQEAAELRSRRDAVWREFMDVVAQCVRRLREADVPRLSIVRGDTSFSGSSYVDNGERGWLLLHSTHWRSGIVATDDGDIFVASNIGPFPAYPYPAIVLREDAKPNEYPSLDRPSAYRGLYYSDAERKILWAEENTWERMEEFSATDAVIDETVRLLNERQRVTALDRHDPHDEVRSRIAPERIEDELVEEIPACSARGSEDRRWRPSTTFEQGGATVCDQCGFVELSS